MDGVNSKNGLAAWLALAVSVSSLVAAQPVPVVHGAEVSAAVRSDLSPPLTALPPVAAQQGPRVHPVLPLPRPAAPSRGDPVMQTFSSTTQAPTIGTSFNGMGNGFSGPNGAFSVNSAPPDPNMAVGPSHIVQLVNTSFAVLTKAGTPIYGPVATNTLWSGFGGGCQTNNDGDGVVQYDALADRWIMTQFSVSTTPFLECVAVSQTSDPTGAWYRYAFSYTDFPDYPKIAVWPDAYYATYNLFNASGTAFLGAKVCAFNRVAMLAGAAATQQCFNTSSSFGGLLASDLDGTALPPAGSPNYAVSLGSAANTLAYWKFHVDWVTPANSTFTGPTTLATAAFADACNDGTCIPQSGTTQKLDSLADRLMYRLAYRNFGDHESLVVNHSVTAGSSVGVRWYELRTAAGPTLSIYQQGTYAPDGNYRWMGSVAMDRVGNIGLGFSLSGSTLHPAIHVSGRLATDALGTMTQGETRIVDGAGSQTGSSLSRWGDYSALRVDPSDGCTFWYTNEYIPANGAFNWSTRIGSFKFPNCATANLAITKTDGTGSVVAGNAVTYTIVASNAGPDPVSGATVTDTLPTALTGATWTCTASAGSSCPASGSGNISTSAVNLAVGGTATFTVVATLSPSATGSLSNTATLNAPAGVTEIDPSNNSATDTDSVVSNNANLSNLVVTTATLVPAFAGATTSYAASVPNATTAVTFTPTVAQANATVRINNVSVASGAASGPIALNVGTNVVTTMVTAQDGVTTKTYTVTLTRLAPPTVTTPTSSGITGTAATLGGNVTSDGGATISERGAVYSVTATNNNPLIGGAGVTKVTGSGTTGVFTVNVSGLSPATGYSFKAYAVNSEGPAYTSVATFATPSNNANLSALQLGVGTLSPSFASGTLAYSTNVVSNTNTVTVTPIAQSAAASIKVNGTTVSSGTASPPITLSVGNNPIQVVVTAQDTISTQTYTVNANYMLPSSCTYSLAPTDLSNMAAAGGPASVTVTTPSGCPVAAFAFQPWVHVVNQVVNLNSTTVQLQIDANAVPSPRATALRLADRLLLVTQLGQ